jgi:hypothetical protein
VDFGTSWLAATKTIHLGLHLSNATPRDDVADWKLLTRVLAIALPPQAKSWKLCASMSLAQLWRDHSKRANCWLRFAGGFTEGFDTRDLAEAKTLLEELGLPRTPQ